MHSYIDVTSLVAQMVKRLSTMWETRVRSLGWEVPWRKKWQSPPVLLPGKSHGQRSLVGYTVHGVAKSQIRLSNFPFNDTVLLPVQAYQKSKS